MKYKNIREEELKIKVAQDYFWLFDCSKIIGNVDFCVSLPHSRKDLSEQSLLWAEAKRGSSDIYKSLVQLILTIGKERTFDKYLPPAYLGAFDYEKIAFIPYNEIHDVFYLNDFNWNVAPSNHETKEFKLIYEKIVAVENSPPTPILWRGGRKADGVVIFNFLKEDAELKRFIKTNLADTKFGVTKIKIDKNNFISIYNKWLQTVKPTIQVDDWELMKKNGIIDGDFYLADLLSVENKSLREKLSVLLNTDLYELNVKVPNIRLSLFARMGFSDNQKAHTQFWKKYERPPLRDYWDYIMNRRDLLVPQDIRERKGSFFTPQIWVELSQKYLCDVLGENWQDEYYVWDCCAGTGNLLAGLTNKYNLWASTLDKTDVDVMKERIQNGANLLESHVFQFDFLNDDFSKLPQGLQDIINDEKKRKKLVVYINPPYAEATTARTMHGTGENKPGVANIHKTKERYKTVLGKGSNEIFAHFLIRFYYEIPSCRIANFSKLKSLQSDNFKEFRQNFQPELEKLFLIPANTFDNVKGEFPIGFFIWNTHQKELFTNITADVYNKEGVHTGTKKISTNQNLLSINKWIKQFKDTKNLSIGFLPNPAPDFQNNNYLFITTNVGTRHVFYVPITQKNLIAVSIYFAVRKAIPATWLNDRDQFLYPNEGWKTDLEFQNDCLACTLFHQSNNISSKEGTNHWIPFTEYVVGASEKFKSNFMTDFINGKQADPIANEPMLFYADTEFGDAGAGIGFKPAPRVFSETARQVFKAGGDLWRYYHTQKFPSHSTPLEGWTQSGRGGYNVNASFYDIREHFQGRNEKGNMNSRSADEHYNELMEILREKMKALAEKIEPKIYEYGFLFN